MVDCFVCPSNSIWRSVLCHCYVVSIAIDLAHAIATCVIIEIGHCRYLYCYVVSVGAVIIDFAISFDSAIAIVVGNQFHRSTSSSKQPRDHKILQS